MEYAIHFCLRYKDNLRETVDKDLALRAAFMTVAPSLLLAAGTTSIGLYAFIPTNYKGVSELGLLAGTSLFICLLITLIALPALLKIAPAPRKFGPRKGQNVFSNLAKKLSALPLRYDKPVAIATLVIAHDLNRLGI